MKATAVRTTEHRPMRQMLSGYIQGYELHHVWRVQIMIGANSYFTSQQTYASRELAARAASRLEGRSDNA